MGMFWRCMYLAFTALFFLLQARVLNSQNLTCNTNDRRALQGFLNGLDSAGVLDGWDSNSTTSNCCNWLGITCNSSSSLGLDDGGSFSSGRVVKLELPRRRLNGILSEALGGLDQLRTLNLSFNFIRGPLPVSLLNLPNLEVLDLSNNDFTGTFPSSTNLPSLQVFGIADNSFHGTLPIGVCQNSTRIRVIDAAVNYFSGNFVPGLGNCSSLEDICLGTNMLSGGLPDDLFQLPKLTRLILADNQFSGQLSNHIGNLSSLVRLDISMNGFSGNIPDVFHRFRQLQYFSAQSNMFSGKIPMSLANSGTIGTLSLRNNSLDGTVDLNCSAMGSLVSLDLATNQFHGTVPANLPLCPRLKTINLAKNNLNGQIPESFKNFQTLSYLSLSNSSIENLSSALGILQHCRNLTTLVLTLNFRGEALPSDPSLSFVQLKALVIANCRLTGTLPEWLSGSTELQLLDLSWNHLTGRIPSWFGNFKSLFYLDLSNNSFTGDIPIELTGLQSLITGNISLEEPSRDVPFFLKKNITTRGLQYNQIWSFPPTLELSNNFLTGPILPEFGNLKKLHVLDLKCNNLSGTIPSSLSNMESLETLDLSHNNLNGPIPASLVELSFLSRFSVAFNNLSGAVPTGRQFATFSFSSYEGNPDLCVDHNTPCDNSKRHSSRRSKKKKAVIIGTVVGVGFGALVVFVILLTFPRTSRRKVINSEEESDAFERDLEEQGSSLLIFFHDKENSSTISIDELLKSTGNFDDTNIIGCGGFGKVYKAILRDGRKVAIKKLSNECDQVEREFQAEVETLSRAQHPNLVHLQGYCKYKNERLLIFSYMENGSLDYWLHEKVDGPSYLDWDRRLQIAQGAARALAYLHQSCEPHILHRDIKSSNILLDENFEAHLADFGLARLILPSDTHVTTDLVGTLGYIPPEYGQSSVATYKGDVYSFGVVLLELLTGRRPMDICKPRGHRDLVSWVFQMKRERKESEVFDPFIYDKEHAEEMFLVLDIACLCLSESPKTRPSTQQLVSLLDSIGPASSFRKC